MDDDTDQEVRPFEPEDRRQGRVTTIQKAIVVGALVALAAGAGSLLTARLTDRQGDLGAQLAANGELASQVRQKDARIGELAGQLSQNEARIAELAGQVAQGVEGSDRLTAEIAALNGKVRDLEAQKAELEKQLQAILDPPPGPTPTAVLTASWVRRAGGSDVVVCIEIENTSRGDATISYSFFQFVAGDAGNFVYPPRQHTPGYSTQLSIPLLTGELRPGEKRRGELLYDVPEAKVLKRLVWSHGLGTAQETTIKLPGGSARYRRDSC